MYIEMKNGGKFYGEGNSEVIALNDANAFVEEGEFCVILGPSGSGKSTLLNMLGGLDRLDKGKIVIDGRDITNYNDKELTQFRREDIGFVFQFYNLIGDLTALENIQVVADIAKSTLDLAEILDVLGIEVFKDRFPKELSGGQQQRVAVARALIKNPKILLCDEVTGALDSKSSIEVLNLLQKVNKKFGMTIVIITHDESIKEIANRVIEIKDGQVISNEVREVIHEIEQVMG